MILHTWRSTLSILGDVASRAPDSVRDGKIPQFFVSGWDHERPAATTHLAARDSYSQGQQATTDDGCGQDQPLQQRWWCWATRWLQGASTGAPIGSASTLAAPPARPVRQGALQPGQASAQERRALHEWCTDHNEMLVVYDYSPRVQQQHAPDLP